ncbi:MAG: hypothetical protein ACXIU8_07015 [Alkalilacustris sp.]
MAVAHRLAIPPLLIGLTVVGFGTSTPWLLVSLDAALRGVPDSAIGSIVGSNIFNILGIRCGTALIAPVPVAGQFLGFDLPVLVAASGVPAGLLVLRRRRCPPAGLVLLVASAASVRGARGWAGAPLRPPGPSTRAPARAQRAPRHDRRPEPPANCAPHPTGGPGRFGGRPRPPAPDGTALAPTSRPRTAMGGRASPRGGPPDARHRPAVPVVNSA